MREVDQSTAPGKVFKLKDGRSLGYLEVGNPRGKPLFHFHGTPGCRLDVLFGQKFAEENEIRFIGLDRPGLGLSDFQPRRKLLDWPDDVIELADALGIEKFAVQGVSGGGPFSLACAYKIPNRLTACGVIVGMGPAYLSTRGMHFANRVIFFLSRYFPWFTGLMLRKSARETQDLEASIESMQEHLDDNFQKHDADALRDPQRMRIFALGAREAFRRGTRGIAYEAKIFMDPWGFRLQDVHCQNLHLWHDELDTNVPVAMARHMAQVIPNCLSHFYPHDGHYSLPLNYFTDIMAALTTV